MNVRVVDASALGAVVFGEPEAERIAEQLSDGLLCAPALLQFELASICPKKIKAYPAQVALIREAFESAGQIAIESVEGCLSIDVKDVAQSTKRCNRS